MNLDHLSAEERRNAMAEIADLYYNQGKTQQEIAGELHSNRFKVAKLLQDARAENIVEIRIHRQQPQNMILEKALLEKYPLNKAIVIDNSHSTYSSTIQTLNEAGSQYLRELLKPGSSIGIAWGKTITGLIQSMEPVAHNPLTAVQLAGCFRHMNSGVGSREMVRLLANAYSGSDYYYLNAPIYINDPDLRSAMLREPMISQTLEKTRRLDVILSGIGGKSSLPQTNPVLRPYISEQDASQIPGCLGSLYGFVLDRNGRIADIELNKKLVSADLADILTTPHRLVAAIGRHKVSVLDKALRSKLYNELVTDSETASRMISLEKDN